MIKYKHSPNIHNYELEELIWRNLFTFVYYGEERNRDEGGEFENRGLWEAVSALNIRSTHIDRAEMARESRPWEEAN